MCCNIWGHKKSDMTEQQGDSLGFPCGSVVKNPPAMQEPQVLSLGWEDPPEEGMATHSSVLTWRMPWKEKPGLHTVHRVLELEMTEAAEHAHTHGHTAISLLMSLKCLSN